jgi:Flp pilus assembly protein TadD
MSEAMSSSVPEPPKADARIKAAARLARHAPPAGPLTGAQQSVLHGALRKAIGLQMEDLRFGLKLAADRMQRGAFAEALQLYIALVLCEPMHADFQLGLANCALHLGENHLAVQAASVVIALRPEDFRGYYISGRASLALKQRDDAEEDLREALALAHQAKETKLAQEIGALLQKLTALKEIQPG